MTTRRQRKARTRHLTVYGCGGTVPLESPCCRDRVCAGSIVYSAYPPSQWFCTGDVWGPGMWARCAVDTSIPRWPGSFGSDRLTDCLPPGTLPARGFLDGDCLDLAADLWRRPSGVITVAAECAGSERIAWDLT